MKKYLVIFEVYASASVEVEADSKEEARRVASGEVSASLCHQCSREVNIDDIGDIVAVEVLEE